ALAAHELEAEARALIAEAELVAGAELLLRDHGAVHERRALVGLVVEEPPGALREDDLRVDGRDVLLLVLVERHVAEGRRADPDRRARELDQLSRARAREPRQLDSCSRVARHSPPPGPESLLPGAFVLVVLGHLLEPGVLELLPGLAVQVLAGGLVAAELDDDALEETGLRARGGLVAHDPRRAGVGVQVDLGLVEAPRRLGLALDGDLVAGHVLPEGVDRDPL